MVMVTPPLISFIKISFGWLANLYGDYTYYIRLYDLKRRCVRQKEKLLSKVKRKS